MNRQSILSSIAEEFHRLYGPDCSSITFFAIEAIKAGNLEQYLRELSVQITDGNDRHLERTTSYSIVLLLKKYMQQLPNFIPMKTEKINEELHAAGYPFRAIGAVELVGTGASWVAFVGPVRPLNASIYVDSNLCRYIRFNDGKILQCTDTDLTGHSPAWQEDLKQKLTGLLL